MKLSRDQKYMLAFGAIVLLGVFSFWAVSQFNASQANLMAEGMSGALVVAVVILGAALVVLGILMPVFVYQIYCDVRKMREIAERNERKLEQMRTDFAQLKQMWQR